MKASTVTGYSMANTHGLPIKSSHALSPHHHLQLRSFAVDFGSRQEGRAWLPKRVAGIGITDAAACHSYEGLTSPSRRDRHHKETNKLWMRLNCLLPMHATPQSDRRASQYNSNCVTMMHFNSKLQYCHLRKATTSVSTEEIHSCTLCI